MRDSVGDEMEDLLGGGDAVHRGMWMRNSMVYAGNSGHLNMY